MADRAGALPFPLRVAVYAAAVLTVLLAPQPPSTRPEAATFETARIESTPSSQPPPLPDASALSPVRLFIATLLVAGVAVDAARRRRPWR